MSKKPIEQSSIIEVLFGEDIKKLREEFKSWFIGNSNDKKKTEKPLVITHEESNLSNYKASRGVVEEFKYKLLVSEPLGEPVALVEFTLKVRRDKI